MSRSQPWTPGAPGVLALPSGRLARGRALNRPLPEGPAPTFGLYLLAKQPPAMPWQSEWLRWPDFRLPQDRVAAAALRDTWEHPKAVETPWQRRYVAGFPPS